MSDSKVEEIIGALWFICSVLAFSGGYTLAGWLFGIKGTGDLMCSIYSAWQEIKAERHYKEYMAKPMGYKPEDEEKQDG